MQPFTVHRGLAAPLPLANVDTDQIIPARYLHRPRDQGFADVLFADLRRDEAGAARSDFVLEQPAHAEATILLAGDNFGCGSSREHAVWAVADAGFRVVVAPSFGDIFANNALKNGLLTLVLPADAVSRLMAAAAAPEGLLLEVDLPGQWLRAPQEALPFEIDAYRKQALMEGLSETAMTARLLPEIEAFEARQARSSPWLRHPPGA